MKNLTLISCLFLATLIFGCSKSAVKPSTSTTTTTTTTTASTNSLVADSVTVYAGLMKMNPTIVNSTKMSSTFSGPVGMAVDASGNLFVAEYNSDDIRKISTNGMVSTISTGIDMPEYLAFDASGNLYVTFGQLDKVSSSGVLSKVGNGIFFGLAADKTGNIYAATQTQIMKLDQTSGKLVAYAGTGTAGMADGALTSASFTNIISMAADQNGNLYVLDGTSIRVVSTTKVQTLALKQSNPFSNPQGIAVDQWDNVYVANYGGSGVANGYILEIGPDGTVSNFAGSGKTATTTSSLSGTAQSASFYGASGITILPSGNMLVSSYGNVIQEIFTHNKQ